MSRKQKTILILFAAGLLVPVGWFAWMNYRVLRATNPEIYPAFRRIENHALLYVKTEKDPRPQEYIRCKRVVDDIIRIRTGKEDYLPTDTQYYGFMRSLGFELPSFSPEGPMRIGDHVRARKEERALLAEQDRILEAHYTD